jgi:hypothetical protein
MPKPMRTTRIMIKITKKAIPALLIPFLRGRTLASNSPI